MAVFRLQENMPDVYPRKSRDFQLLCNTFDAMLNAVKFDIDSIIHTADTSLCSDRLLPLLQTKLGFFSKESFSTKELRTVLQVFKYVVRNKGSRIGIQTAIAVFLKLANASNKSRITITDTYIDDYGYSTTAIAGNTYIIEVAIEGKQVDTTLLTELLKYVLPAGYKLKYSFYTALEPVSMVSANDTIDIAFVNIGDSRGIRATTSNDSTSRYPYELTFSKYETNEDGGESYFYTKENGGYKLRETMPADWPNGEYYKKINGTSNYTPFTVVETVLPEYTPGVYYYPNSNEPINSTQTPDEWGQSRALFYYQDFSTGNFIPVEFTYDYFLVDHKGNKEFDGSKFNKDESGSYIYYIENNGSYSEFTEPLSTRTDDVVYLCSMSDVRFERVYLPYNSINGVSTTAAHPSLDSWGKTYSYSAETAYTNTFKDLNGESIQPITFNKGETSK